MNKLDSWDKVEAFALTLPGTEPGTTYRMPAVKVAANGRSFVWTSGEPDTSFAIWLDPSTNEMLMENRPRHFLAIAALRRQQRGADPLCERRSRSRPLHDRAGL
jgi:hypothetical protein